MVRLLSGSCFAICLIVTLACSDNKNSQVTNQSTVPAPPPVPTIPVPVNGIANYRFAAGQSVEWYIPDQALVIVAMELDASAATPPSGLIVATPGSNAYVVIYSLTRAHMIHVQFPFAVPYRMRVERRPFKPQQGATNQLNVDLNLQDLIKELERPPHCGGVGCTLGTAMVVNVDFNDHEQTYPPFILFP